MTLIEDKMTSKRPQTQPATKAVSSLASMDQCLTWKYSCEFAAFSLAFPLSMEKRRLMKKMRLLLLVLQRMAISANCSAAHTRTTLPKRAHTHNQE